MAMARTALHEIDQQELTSFEKQSILDHAVELHLVGSDEADHAGFELIDAKADTVLHLFRITFDNEPAGLLYLLPLGAVPDHIEMTVLIHETFRGKHLTSEVVAQIEHFLSSKHAGTITLCATVREHNPLRKELTAFLLRHGYQYSPEYMSFVKTL
jgi:hypothetical protein